MTAARELVRVGLEENDLVLEQADAAALERGEVSDRLVNAARAAGGHELRLWRKTSRGWELVKTILPEGVAELVAFGGGA